MLVAKLLRAAGWRVYFYGHRRGFGFDLYASRADSALVIEVKSSLTELGALTLTRLEYEAALHYGPNFLLVTVEHLGSDNPVVGMIQDPAHALRIDARENLIEYYITREQWSSTRVPFTEITD